MHKEQANEALLLKESSYGCKRGMSPQNVRWSRDVVEETSMYVPNVHTYLPRYTYMLYLLTANAADLPKVEHFKEATCFGDP